MAWSLSQLMPICPVPHCPKYGSRHLLPHQEEIATQILQGNENYIYYQGGVGSAKTILFGALTAALAIMIPQSRGILFRISFELNAETLWGYFMASVISALEQGIIQGTVKDIFSVKKAGVHTQAKLPNGSMYKAAETPNWRRQIGPNYDVITISDAMENENFGAIFHGEGTVGGLQSRLRGQASSFFKLPSGEYRDMRRFLIESNPPPNINELHRIFGTEPGVRYFSDSEISYRYIETSSAQNDHNPPSYVAEITSQHTDPGDIKRILGGKTVPYYGGVKVITTFQPEYHVNEFEVDHNLPLLVSIDPGYQHPGVTFSQIKRCSYEKEHCITLSEISNLFNRTTIQLGSMEEGDLLGILEHLALFYPEFLDYEGYCAERKRSLKDRDDNPVSYEYLEGYFARIRFCIDRAGDKKYSTNKDRETDRIVLLKNYGIRCQYRTAIGLERSLDRVREAFQTLCVCNVPIILIDRKCHLLIDGYSGGYRFSKNRDGSHKDTPVEDHVYEDICDSHRYALENFLWCSGYAGKDIEELPIVHTDRYSWMTNGYSEPRGLYERMQR